MAVRATALSRDIAFMVMISGGGVSPHESEIYSYRVALEEAGFDENQVAEALSTVDVYMSYLRTGKGRDAAAARDASSGAGSRTGIRRRSRSTSNVPC